MKRLIPMNEWIKTGISLLTLTSIVIGVYVTIDQMRSANEIRLEASRTRIFASTESQTLFNIMNKKEYGPKESIFLRAIYAHYITVYRSRSRTLIGALSKAYVADAAGGFCWLLSKPGAKEFWKETKKGSDSGTRKAKLRGQTDPAKMETEWCEP